MENVKVFGDNVYATNAIEALLKNGSCNKCSEDLSILVIEKKWISLQELSLLMSSEAERFYVLCQSSLQYTLSTLDLPGQIQYQDYGADLATITKSLNEFISVKSDKKKSQIIIAKRNLLSTTEKTITSLYIRGVSLQGIAMQMNRSIKTVSAHKRSTMKKLGLGSDVALINVGRLVIDYGGKYPVNSH
jgi:DNA-binding CsgD family transcriptional regulator